jgi:pSer/pThr/pTyr-binding forkhead associated (FHA) protein
MPDQAAIPTPPRRFTVMLRNERTTIGSESTNDVVLPGLAPHHAAITRQDGRWVVAPADGEIMVAYNGEANAERRINGTNAIKHGSVIRFGTIRAIFQAKDQPELLIEGM